MTQVELNEQSAVIFGIKHTFVHGTYNGMTILTDTLTGFVNATKFVRQFKTRNGTDKEFRKVARGESWEEFVEEFEHEYAPDSVLLTKIKKNTCRPKLGVRSRHEKWWSYELNQQLQNSQIEFRGTYIDPRMINTLACFINPKYLITVNKIMDAINERVHAKLDIESKPDIVENSTKIFKEEVKTFIDNSNRRGQAAYESQSCWQDRENQKALYNSGVETWKRDALGMNVNYNSDLDRKLNLIRRK